MNPLFRRHEHVLRMSMLLKNVSLKFTTFCVPSPDLHTPSDLSLASAELVHLHLPS